MFLRQVPDIDNEGKTLEELSVNRYYQYLREIIKDEDVIEFPNSSWSKIMGFDVNKYKHIS